MEKLETIELNNIKYVREDQLHAEKAETLEGLPYVIIRTYSAGVHAGYLKSRDGKEVELLKSRRIYQWSGASTLSQLAQSGTSKPESCKFPEAVDRMILTEAIEILDVTKKAKKTIDAVEIWKS
tara:strand:+ start:179 stop:550 length:372 start_codon:yes stop_codon:yes gene_type:complete